MVISASSAPLLSPSPMTGSEDGEKIKGDISEALQQWPMDQDRHRIADQTPSPHRFLRRVPESLRRRAASGQFNSTPRFVRADPLTNRGVDFEDVDGSSEDPEDRVESFEDVDGSSEDSGAKENRLEDIDGSSEDPEDKEKRCEENNGSSQKSKDKGEEFEDIDDSSEDPEDKKKRCEENDGSSQNSRDKEKRFEDIDGSSEDNPRPEKLGNVCQKFGREDDDSDPDLVVGKKLDEVANVLDVDSDSPTPDADRESESLGVDSSQLSEGRKRPRSPDSNRPRFLSTKFDETPIPQKPTLIFPARSPTPTPTTPSAFYTPSRRGEKYVRDGLAVSLQSLVISTAEEASQQRKSDFWRITKAEIDLTNSTIVVAEGIDQKMSRRLLFVGNGSGGAFSPRDIRPGQTVQVRKPVWELGEALVCVEWRVDSS